jgi:hypothetical protein
MATVFDIGFLLLGAGLDDADAVDADAVDAAHVGDFGPLRLKPGHFFERQTNSHAHAKPWDVAPHFETEVVAPKKDD